MPKVSVLMPVYNTKEEFLKESVESILNQTYQEFELIIVDDGSSNDVEAIIKKYNDSRIRFYKNEQNLGVAKTRNKLLGLAQGEYCAWQDSDDIAYPERLEKQVEFLDKNKEISAVGSYLEQFPNKKIVKMLERPKIIDFLGGCQLSQPTAMLRIADFRKYNLEYNTELITSEDYDLWARGVKYLSYANMQEPLLKYRLSSSSLYHTANKYAYKLDKEIKNELINYLTENEKLQKNIMTVVSSQYLKKGSFWENIFGIRNEWYGDKKVKILLIAGIKIKLWEKGII